MTNENVRIPKILIVDDVDTNRYVLKDIIDEMGYQPILAENGAQALKIVERFELQLIILDVAMPVMDGYEFCRIIKQNANTREIPIIFISAFDNPSDMIKGLQLGGADYITKPFIPEVVKVRVAMQLSLADASRVLQEMNSKLQVSVSDQLRQVENEKKNILYALIRVARENPAYDEGHMERLSRNCRILTEALQLTVEYEKVISDTYIETMELAAPLCDLGNAAISTDILQKKDSLTEEETVAMKRHTEVGERILRNIADLDDDNGFVQMARDIAYYHHENWDGSGYPCGIKEDEIPLCAQIISVVNAYCELTETGRESCSQEEAFSVMEKEAGTKFNPFIFSVLYKIRRLLE